MKAPQLVIRPALLSDLPAMLRIAESSHGLPHWSSEAYRSLFDEQTSPVRRMTVVAEVTGKVVAFGVLSTVAGLLPMESEIENLGVDQAWRRQGIGGAVLSALLEQARQLGDGIVRLEVRSSNTGASALYCRFGFRETGRRRNYYQAPMEDAVLLEREVGRAFTGGCVTGSGIISATYGS